MLTRGVVELEKVSDVDADVLLDKTPAAAAAAADDDGRCPA